MPVDAQKVVKKCLRKNLSPNLAFGVGKETWEETALRNEERKVVAETILSMEVKKRE